MQLANGYEKRLADIAAIAAAVAEPRVYFEEWDDPLISGIGWVSELIEIAGGVDILPRSARAQGRQGPHRRAGDGARRARPT